MTQVGAPAVGEILADRYRIEEHINDDSTGRQVWRGVDVILRRAVTIVLRAPGGAEADEMLGAAVAASRVVHPNIVGVYDAIDEGSRAYVVREWVEGRSLRDVVREAPLDPARAISVSRAVADAVAAVHATGVSHGNVHPGTVLLSVDNRVVLGDARANERATVDGDVRAVGAVLYCALTGYWPRFIPGPAALPDAPMADDGRLASPRQVRQGVPAQLDQLTMDLLEGDSDQPGAAELAVELTRMGYHDRAGYQTPAYYEADYQEGHEPTDYQGYDTRVTSPLDFVSNTDHGLPPDDRRSSIGKKILVGVAGVLVIALAGLLLGVFLNTNSSDPSASGPDNRQGSGADAGEPQPIALNRGMVRLVDPPQGDRTEGEGIELAVDGDTSTGWPTQEYTASNFGNIKPGMGLLIDLGKKRSLSEVQLTLSAPETTVEIRHGDTDYGDSSAGDAKIDKKYQEAAPPRSLQANAKIPVDVETRYLLIWITELPAYQDGTFQVELKEIQILAGA